MQYTGTQFILRSGRSRWIHLTIVRMSWEGGTGVRGNEQAGPVGNFFGSGASPFPVLDSDVDMWQGLLEQLKF